MNNRAFDKLSCEDSAPETTREAVTERLVDEAEVAAHVFLLSAGGVTETLASPPSAYALEIALEFAARDERAAGKALADAACELADVQEWHPLAERLRAARSVYHEAQAELFAATLARLAG